MNINKQAEKIYATVTFDSALSLTLRQRAWRSGTNRHSALLSFTIRGLSMLHNARDLASFFLMSLHYENLLRTRVALSFLVPVPVRQLGGQWTGRLNGK